ncbi:FG-GAP repeat domain-containing protein [Streptomyces sp. NPDC058486]|uniref:FG-GAP repeat domain-containing protein n=1 Tax=unclassified Streptomyces TaxID=2593676 RepID=UPI00365EF64A
MKNRTTRKRPALAAVVVASTAAALLGTALAPQGTAAPAADGTEPGLTASPPPSPEELALQEAKETGGQAEVIARRTENSQLFVDASGTFTEDRYVLPRWTLQDNALVPIDTTLVKTDDGRVTTRATKADISFSAGGTGTTVTLGHNNQAFALSWPQALPEPRLNGDTATYPEVLPGVDLLLRAGNSGFSQLLVVKTPEAAANPELDTIRFGMSTDGVDVATDPHGNLTATNSLGQEVFTAPAPRMWDSSAPAGLARTAMARAQTTSPDNLFEPGQAAKQADLDVSVGAGSLSLTPDQSLLTGEDTTYPVFIDPEYAIPGAREAWAIAYQRTPNTAYFGGAGWHNSDESVGTNTARVGYENVTNGLARSFFRMDTNNLWNTKKDIKWSTFFIENNWSWSCEHRPVELWLTGGISSATTWNNQDNDDMWATKSYVVDDARGWSSACPGGNLAFDVTPEAVKAQNGKWGAMTLGLRASNESDVFAWKKFDAGSAKLRTVYNTYPNAVRYPDTNPDTGTTECVANQGMLTKTLGNTDLMLRGVFSDPDGGMVKARFVLWPSGHHDSGPKINTTVDVTSGNGASLIVTKEKLEKLATASGTETFFWYARAEDGELSGAWTKSCQFVFDSSSPETPPTVSSTTFPDGTNGWPATTGMARDPGSFNVIAHDSGPSPKIEYWTDWDPTVRKTTGTWVTLTLRPPSAGRHILSVRSIDAGGNISLTTRYSFYANSPGTPDAPGDLNGDGTADFYGVRTDGELWIYSGQGDGGHAAASVASGQDFSGSSISHRGDWNQDGYEDLIALVPGADGKKELKLYPNNGFGYACTSSVDEQADGAKYCQYDVVTFDLPKRAANVPLLWADASEILAVGDVDGFIDQDTDGVYTEGKDIPARPDLLVKRAGELWLVFGTSSKNLDTVKDPIKVGTGGWTNLSLVAPGDYDKNGHVDLLARDKASGELKLYRGIDKSGMGLGNGSASSVIGVGWTVANRPLFTAVPDANGDGKSDLWATSGDGKLLFYSNPAGVGTVVGNGGWSEFQSLS